MKDKCQAEAPSTESREGFCEDEDCEPFLKGEKEPAGGTCRSEDWESIANSGWNIEKALVGVHSLMRSAALLCSIPIFPIAFF